jgi:hypothetical protein
MCAQITGRKCITTKSRVGDLVNVTASLGFGCFPSQVSVCVCVFPLSNLLPSPFLPFITCAFVAFVACVGPTERVENQMKLEIKEQVMKRIKETENKLARAARFSKRGLDAGDDFDTAALRESLFINGLIDSCPRCGLQPECDARDVDEHRAHLRACTDAAAHAAHQQREARAKVKAEKKEMKQAAQDDVASKAAFDFLGTIFASVFSVTCFLSSSFFSSSFSFASLIVLYLRHSICSCCQVGGRIICIC